MSKNPRFCEKSKIFGDFCVNFLYREIQGPCKVHPKNSKLRVFYAPLKRGYISKGATILEQVLAVFAKTWILAKIVVFWGEKGSDPEIDLSGSWGLLDISSKP